MDTTSKAFKDVFFDLNMLRTLGAALERQITDFSFNHFLKKVYSDGWETKELMPRVKHLAVVLHEFLPEDFPKAAGILSMVADDIRNAKNKQQTFGFMCLAEYISSYGLNHLNASVRAMETITKLISCEFAVRPFIIRYPRQMMAIMMEWSRHEDAKVRRLASEGCRPRLPWGLALRDFKTDPSPILPILEALKEDPDEWVRKSVANNLNDISKDHPQFLLQLIKKWKGKNAQTDALLKHAARNLLKRGDEHALALFGVRHDQKIKADRTRILTPTVHVGSELRFEFEITNDSRQNKLVRLEYAIYYNTARGVLSKKVYKISEKEYKAGTKYHITRKQSFKPITTRRFYAGKHELSVIVNGKESKRLPFELATTELSQ
jgi:3-methyladenine DNA glycosylase AlkC